MKHYDCSYEQLQSIKSTPHILPTKPVWFWKSLGWILSAPELFSVGFKINKVGMDKLGKNEPALIFMNHSNFLDYKILMHSLYDRKVNIVTTFDALIGRELPMRGLGCFPTRKFTTDYMLIRDIKYCIKELGTSVLMFPEADYSYGGRSHTVPPSAAGLIKMLGVPFCMLETRGAFMCEPEYNYGNKRKCKVSAELRYVLSPEQISQMTVEEIDDVVQKQFNYDGFRWQQENKVVIDNPERARGLEKILYKCPHCHSEGETKGEKTHLTCLSCGKRWELTELGFLRAESGDTEFEHIPDWYDWERECIRKEIIDNKYGFDVSADIYALVDMKGLYKLGEGRISHNMEGMHLTAFDGKINFFKKSISMYASGVTFYWEGINDGISIGDNSITYIAAPKLENGHLVMKSRFATEEIYKIIKNKGN